MWNYRLVRAESEHLGEKYFTIGIHEVYYNEDNKIIGHVADPVISASAFYDDDLSEPELIDDLKGQLELLQRTFDGGDVLTEEQLCG